MTDDTATPSRDRVPAFEVITLADVRKDLGDVKQTITELTVLVREQLSGVNVRVLGLEEGKQDHEARIRVVEQDRVTRAEFDSLKAAIDERQEAARGRFPAWAGVAVAVAALIVTLLIGVATIMLSITR